jgi:GAF domain-containing protein/HAMP domain-containing protein
MSFFESLLQRAGGYYPIVVAALAQVFATPLGLALSGLILLFNAEFTISEVAKVWLFDIVIIFIRNAFLLASFYYSNRSMVNRLKEWKQKGKYIEANPKEERKAWRQVTNFAWRYVEIAFTTLMAVIVPLTIYYVRVHLGANFDQQIYTLLAGIVGGLGFAILEVLIIESWMIPAQKVLVPKQFETQLTAFSGVRLLGKLIVILFSIVLISAFLVAPIGYHQATRILYEEIGSLEVLSDLQIQSIVATGFALLFGLGLALLMGRLILQPVQLMIESFNKIENGDLSQRIDITATDEMGKLGIYFNRMIGRLEELQAALEKRVQERTEQLRSTIEVGQAASRTLEPNELITKVVNLITERFGYYYAAIFLTDSTGHWAELKDATGTAGQILKSRGHRLEIGGKSMVSAAIVKREAQIALDVGAAPVRFENPLLPQTRSEIALPLMVGDHVLGALDVQSIQEAAFDEDDIQTLQGMANQVAVALENARLFQEIQHSLEELRAAHKLYIAEAWSRISSGPLEYEYGTPAESPAQNAESKIDVPLTLRDEPIGVLSIEGNADWGADEKALIEAVATQAALALENARLLEESQQVALRERLAAEIISKIWASPNMESILHTLIKEVGRALRADEATIELDIE